MNIDLTDDEFGLLIEALDSHVYWQLSGLSYRNSGYVLDPGSDDEEQAAEIQASYALTSKLEAARQKGNE